MNDCSLYRDGNGDLELMEQYHKDVADLQKRYCSMHVDLVLNR